METNKAIQIEYSKEVVVLSAEEERQMLLELGMDALEIEEMLAMRHGWITGDVITQEGQPMLTSVPVKSAA